MMDKVIAANKQARFEYSILETLEAGIALKGSEVKSLRDGKASLSDSFVRIDKGEAFVYNFHIPPYAHAGRSMLDPIRARKLLLHKNEIARLAGQVQQKGLTIVPLKAYFKRGFAKLEIALAKGKKRYDKREAIKKREVDREMHRGIRN